jgi:sortase A
MGRLFLRRCSTVFLLGGLLALGSYLFVSADAHIYQAHLSWRFDQILKGRGHRSPAIQAGSLIGRMEVPRLGFSAMVLEGDGAPTLLRGIGHIPGTALPGERGNIAIAGHRDTFFRSLRNIRANDIITLTTSTGRYRYRVESIDVVKPEHTEVLEASAQPTLTLVTCYPFSYVGMAPDRFVVRAGLVAGPPRPGRLASEKAAAGGDSPRRETGGYRRASAQ